MTEPKDIRFTEKRVDESWKEQIARDKGANAPSASSLTKEESSRASAPKQTSKPFLNFLNSMAFQAMMFLGEIPNPETRQKEIHLDAAKEAIDLLASLKQKTEGNLSAEEADFFNTLLPEIQIKFAEKA